MPTRRTATWLKLLLALAVLAAPWRVIAGAAAGSGCCPMGIASTHPAEHAQPQAPGCHTGHDGGACFGHDCQAPQCSGAAVLSAGADIVLPAGRYHHRLSPAHRVASQAHAPPTPPPNGISRT